MNEIKLEIYKDIGGKFRWSLKAGNGEKVAASEAYGSKAAAIASAQKVKVWAGLAVIVDTTNSATPFSSSRMFLAM